MEEKADNVHFGDQKLVSQYLKAAKELGFEDLVRVLPEQPEWSDAAVEINLGEEASKNFFDTVEKIREREESEGE